MNTNKDWLDIASAPKDGTPVLLFARLAGRNVTTNAPYAPTIHVGAYRPDLHIWTGSAYREQREIEIEAISWMPLPSFPSSPASTVPTEGEKDELIWRDGEPPFPQNQEWFIAETTYGDRVVLCALPKGMRHDYKTADETYLRANLVKRWMQFPDCEYLPPEAPAAGDALERQYTNAMGVAGQRYMDCFPYAHALPAGFRWEDLWNAMQSAATQVPQQGEA